MTLLTGRIGRAVLIAIAALAGPATASLRAQSNAAPFVVAVPDVYPADEGYGFILRTGDAQKQDVIIMNRETLDAKSLIAALSLLRRLREQSAVPADATEITTVQGFAPWRGRQPRARPAVERALAQIRAAPRVRIGNVGQGRWLELTLDVLR